MGGATRSGDDDPPGRLPPERPARRVWNNFRAPRPVGSGYDGPPSALLTPTIARRALKRAWARVSAEAHPRNIVVR
jgi:hypothetical protein